MPTPLLTKEVARATAHRAVVESFDLPERVVQFGTGAFLRGFAEYFVARANEAGILNGRVVMVGSTGSGRAQHLNEQEGLYTLLVRGRSNGQVVDDGQVVAAVSRAVASQEHWTDVLACAHNPALLLVISNTTEVGITLDDEDRIDASPPHSFPGKLTALLYERARAFEYDPAKGVIILPCELIEANGDTLRGIVHALAERWNLGAAFVRWLDEANRFCNTLVDRIVPGTPAQEDLAALYDRLGYRDDLLTVAEPYRLWAIEGDAELEQRLPLAGTDPGIVVTADITPYRVRKVRILNGTHTLMVPLALLCGAETVYEATEHPLIARFLRQVMFNEVAPGLDGDQATAQAFARAVLERFANPFIRHELIDITFQQTMKMRVRVVPSLRRYVEMQGVVPPSITFGFAAFLLYQHPDYRPASNAPKDDAASYWQQQWAGVDLADEGTIQQIVAVVGADEERWGVALDTIPKFTETVTAHVARMVRDGVPGALEAHLHTVAS